MQTEAPPLAKWGKVLDQTRCIGCHACTTACKSENLVPLGVTRTYVKHVDVGVWPQARRAHQVTRCNQCAHAPCVTACPTSAMFKRPDGIVDFDKSVCIGCKACMAACPYDAIFINPEDHSAEKCNFCAHRIDAGLEPACVVVCPTEAILVGDMNDPDSRVAHYVNREAVEVRRPEKETRPKVFYKGAHQATLDPLAARRPGGGLFMWSEQKQDAATVNSGNPAFTNTSAAALLAYDVPHSLPWDWRVSLYTWTKGIAAGAYLVAALLTLLVMWNGPGPSPAEGSGVLWRWVAPVLSGAFLALTGGLLIWDLEHPERFYMIFTRPQW
ncbi:MAG TPA: 4Fe-4S dicluster domain-containing protein, partial [Pyrinomonadaceae bacterium]